MIASASCDTFTQGVLVKLYLYYRTHPLIQNCLWKTGIHPIGLLG